MLTSVPKRYDAFLSYNSLDTLAVQELAERLQSEKLELYLEQWELAPGREFQPALAEGLRASKTCVVFLGPNGLGPWQKQEIQVAIDKRARDSAFPVIPVLLPGAERPRRGDVAHLEFLINASWVEFLKTLADGRAFHKLVWGITGQKPTDPEAGRYEGICPYRGLEAFRAEDAPFFFGREALTGWLISALRREVRSPQGVRFLGVLGPSGSGKSSVVLASLVPKLKAGAIEGSAAWPIAILRPGDEPLKNLAAAVVSLFQPQGALPDVEQARKLMNSLRDDPEGQALDLFVCMAMHGRPADERLVLVVDQFEEVFTYRPQDDQARARFEKGRAAFLANLLNATATSDGRVAVVLTMRSDFLGACAPFTQLAAVLSAHQELVGPMTREELREAIEQPAYLVGCEVEQALTERLLADIGGQLGALPLLQFALTEVWKKRDVRRLTLRAYEDLGGLTGTLEQRANEIFRNLSAQDQALCRNVFLRLVQPGEGTEDTKRRVSFRELLPENPGRATAIKQLVQALADRDTRLLTTEGDAETGGVVEVAHEALVRGWPQLRQWLHDEREGLRINRRLTEAARVWADASPEHKDGYLYSGGQLAVCREWARVHREELNVVELTFLAASEEAERLKEQKELEAERRLREAAEAKAKAERKRRHVQLALMMTVLFGVLAGGGAIWLFEQHVARRQQAADTAAEQAMAKARILVEQAKTAPLLEMVRFQEALVEAQTAEKLADTGGASDTVRQQAKELVGRIGRETQAAQHDERLATALLEMHAPPEGQKFEVDEHGRMMELVEQSPDEQFKSAFLTWGLDVDATPTAEAVARLKNCHPAVVVVVIARLDERAIERRRQPKMPAANWQRLMDLAQALDTTADPRRRELRAILARDHLKLERALGKLARALRPVPIPSEGTLGADQIRLQQLTAKTDVAKEPVLGLLVLVRALSLAGQEDQAERLLSAALLSRPREVVLHQNMGEILEFKTPPNLGKAVECYRAMRVLRPDLGVFLANALIKVGRKQEGLALFKQLIAENPNNYLLRNRRGMALYNKALHQEAEAEFLAAIRLKPDFHPAYTNLGILLQAQGQYKEAEAAHQKAIQLKPDSHQGWGGLGAILQAQDRYKEAAAALQKAIQLKPDYAEAYYGLGLSLNKQDRHKEAEAAHRKAIQLQPDYYEAYCGLGNVLWHDKVRSKQAEAAYKKAIQLKVDYHPAYHGLGVILHAQGRDKEAEAAFQKAIQLKPDYHPAYNGLGLSLNKQDRHKEAEAAYQKAIQLKADYYEAHINLGVLLRAKGRDKDAEVAYQKAIQLKPDCHQAYNNLGVLLHAQGRDKEAEAAFQKVIQLKPDCHQAYNGLGVLLKAQGQSKEAEAAYQKAIQLKADYYPAYTSLGLLLHAQGRYKEATAEFQKAIQFKSDYAEAHHHLGVALRNQGRFVESLEAFRKGHAFGSKLPGWRDRSTNSVQMTERLLELDAKLPAYLVGDTKVATATEWLELAVLCKFKGLHVSAARFAAKAFAEEPNFADDLAKQSRYHAACSALLAAAGDAEDAKKLTDKDKASLRLQAFAWLRADLTLYGKLADVDAAKHINTVFGGWTLLTRLTSWHEDVRLTSVRNQETLSKLSEAERDAWHQLWADIEAVRLRAKAGSQK